MYMYQHWPDPLSIKQRRKSVDLSPKSFFWTSKQLFAIHFLLASCNVCPLAIPELFAHNMGIRLLANHSFASMRQPKNSLQLPKSTRNTRKIANKFLTVAFGESCKHDLIRHVPKMKAATSAHSMVDLIFPSNLTLR